MAKLFSVIVPVYNVESFLVRCLDSILKQAYEDFELILVDDGSTDRSGEICDSYCQKDSRCRVIHQQNKGLAGARNTGLREAKGSYIIFVDSDDYVEKELLLKVADKLDKGYDICSFCARRVDVEEKLLYEMRFDDMIQEITFTDNNRDDIICDDFLQYKAGWEAWLQAYSKSFLEEYHFAFDESVRYAEDLIFTVDTLLYANRWIKIPDILYNYTYREQSLSVISNEQKMRKMDGVKAGIKRSLEKKYTGSRAESMKERYVNSLMMYLEKRQGMIR